MATTVSALVLTYNQEDLIAQAIMSLVEQTCQLTQIVISDDGSTDQTWNVIQETLEKIRGNHLYSGDIVLNRNDSNLGFIDNFNLGVSLCDSDLIMYNAGDDISMPFRNEMFLNEYKKRGNPKYFLGHSQVLIGESNIRTPPIEMGSYSFERLSISCALHIGASQYFSKSLFDDFGEIKFKNTYEDLILGYRALLTESYCYIAQPLVKYDTSGLSGWTKNDYWRKRLRFKETLEQRIIDTAKFGRSDVIDHIIDCYQQYGYGVVKHPSSVRFVWLNIGSNKAIFSAYQSVNFDFIRPFVEITEVSDWRSIKDTGLKNFYVHYEDFINIGKEFILELPMRAKMIVDVGILNVNIESVSRITQHNSNIEYIFLSSRSSVVNLIKAYESVYQVENFYNIDGPLSNEREGFIVINDSDESNSECGKIMIRNFDFDMNNLPVKYSVKDFSCVNMSSIDTLVYFCGSLDESQERHLCDLSVSNGFNLIICQLDIGKISINDFFSTAFNSSSKYLVNEYLASNHELTNNYLMSERNRKYFESSIQKRVVDYKNVFEMAYGQSKCAEKIYPL